MSSRRKGVQLCRCLDCDGAVRRDNGRCLVCGVFQPHPIVNKDGQIEYPLPSGETRFAGGSTSWPKQYGWTEEEDDLTEEGLGGEPSIVSLMQKRIIELEEDVSVLQAQVRILVKKLDKSYKNIEKAEDVSRAVRSIEKSLKRLPKIAKHIKKLDARTAWMKDKTTNMPYAPCFDEADEDTFKRFRNLELD